MNQFGTRRLFSVCASKIALNGYNVLELSKPYDALGFLKNGHQRTDCIRAQIFMPQEVEYACTASKQRKLCELLNNSQKNLAIIHVYLKLNEILNFKI
jgi:hypothetical protein